MEKQHNYKWLAEYCGAVMLGGVLTSLFLHSLIPTVLGLIISYCTIAQVNRLEKQAEEQATIPNEPTGLS